MSGDGIYFRDTVDLIAEQFNADIELVRIGRRQVNDITADAHCSPALFNVISCILQFNELSEQGVAVIAFSHSDRDEHVFVFNRIGCRVDASNGSDNDRVSSFQQGIQCALTEHIQFLIDGCCLFNIHVILRHICLRLVVVEVGNEEFHSVFGKEFLELGIQLSCQGLIMGKDQCGTVDPFDHIGHGKCLSGTCGTFQHLFFFSFLKTSDEFIDCLGLIAGRLEGRNQFKTVSHSAPPVPCGAARRVLLSCCSP